MPEAFCGLETVRKKALLTLWALWEKENSFVREKTPQRVTCVSFHSESVFYFSQIYTEEQNTQRPTETLSQPITQSVTANVSWKASVNSVCRGRSVGSKGAPKGSVKSVSSVRENHPTDNFPMLFFSQKNPEEQNTQGSIQVMPTDTPTIYNKVLMSPSPFSLLFTKLFQFLLDKIKVINSFLFILRTVVFFSPFPNPIEIKLQPFRVKSPILFATQPSPFIIL